jgi:acetoacetate decarboxylase
MVVSREEKQMTEEETRKRAFAMPLTSPAFPPGPYRFVNREYLILTYRTDPEKLRAALPEPLEFDAPLVKYEFIRMPDSTGFGDYTESGQVIPVRFDGRQGAYTHCMFLDDEAPIAGGANSGVSRRNSRPLASRSKRIRSSAPSTTGRCASRPARWAISIAQSTWPRLKLRSVDRII